ncbi:MAG: hypothetical protein IKS10_07755 [Lachnospiraceae bacterium]|nr:hypothetical protein [Lachnospiraceae bacterium]
MAEFTNYDETIEKTLGQVRAIGENLHERIRRDEFIYVALPFLMFRRFDEVIGPEMGDLVNYAREHDDLELKDLDERVRGMAPFETYNCSGLSLKTLATDKSKQDIRFRDYLNGFSVNVRRLLASLRFHSIFPSLVRFVLLGDVCNAFSAEDLKLDAVSMPSSAYEKLLKNLLQEANASSPNGDCGIGEEVIARIVRATGEIRRIEPGSTASLEAFENASMVRTDPELLAQKLEAQKKAAEAAEKSVTDSDNENNE